MMPVATPRVSLAPLLAALDRFLDLADAHLAKADNPALVAALERAAQRAERDVAATYQAAVTQLREQFSEQRVRAWLDSPEADLTDAQVDDLPWQEHERALLAGLVVALGAAFLTALRAGARHDGGPDGTEAADLAIVRAAAADWAERRAAAAVAEVTAGTRAAIRAVIAGSIRAGLSVEETAAELRTMVGLTEAQAAALQAERTRLLADGRLSRPQIRAALAVYGEELRAARTLTIAATETWAAAQAGLVEGWAVLDALDLLPPDHVQVWRIQDASACERCRELDGETRPIGQAFPEGPPAHPNCLPGDALVAPGSRIAATSARIYQGDMVILRTASGKRLACTPNHPILTPGGWVQAGRLHVGSDVISSRLRQWGRSCHDHHEEMPARIEDVARALRLARVAPPTRVPVAAEDFHGDGAGSQVAVIWADGSLRGHDDASLLEHPREARLLRASELCPSLPSRRESQFGRQRDRAPCGRGVRCADLALALRGGHALPLEPLRLALGAPRYPVGGQPSGDDAARDAEALGERILREATDVEPDRVRMVEAYAFHGPVYNLQTGDGFYMAGGIITQNCRCSLVLEPRARAE